MELRWRLNGFQVQHNKIIQKIRRMDSIEEIHTMLLPYEHPNYEMALKNHGFFNLMILLLFVFGVYDACI